MRLASTYQTVCLIVLIELGNVVMIEGKRTEQMIVRLATSRHRTAISKARKKTTRYSIKLEKKGNH